jgi:kynurenine formamidase
MKQRFVKLVILLGVLLPLPSVSNGIRAGENAASGSPLTLEDVASGKARLIDLTYPLNDRNPYWPGPGYTPFKLKTIATLEKNGVLSQAFSTPEHLGTHLDAPNHFERNQPDVSALPAETLFARGVLLDVSPHAAADPDYRLTPAEIARWEREHGPIPTGAVVLLHTGWGAFWNNYSRYTNQDVQGRMHFPSYSAEAARLLIHERKAKGLGIDTLSIDYGLSRDFVVHHVVNKAGRYGLENVANLDRLPPRGFFLVVAPIKIEHGSGGPTRIFAILPRESAEHR